MADNIIELILNAENKVTIYLYGSTITSWISNGEEVLFLRWPFFEK